MTNRQSTHGHECWSWGPAHYECAVRQVEQIVSELQEWRNRAQDKTRLWRQAMDERDAARSEADRLRAELAVRNGELDAAQAALSADAKWQAVINQIADDEERMHEQIELWARQSYRRSRSGVRGTTITRGDSEVTHYVWAALRWAHEREQAEARELRAELARVRELCPEVIAFAHLMQHKLNMNAHKDGEGWGRDSSGKRGWKSCSPQFLMDKLYEEVLELTIAIHEGDSAKSIRQEAADVGNIAMMLADVCGALSQPAEQHDPLAVSDRCPECSEPEPECVCGEQPAERESGKEGQE